MKDTFDIAVSKTFPTLINLLALSEGMGDIFVL